MKHTNIDQIKQILRSAGQRATETRIAILQVFQAAKQPLSMEEVVEAIRSRKGDQSTVYRTVNALVESGVIRPVDLRHSHGHFELVSNDHHHVVCTRCGKVEKFTGCGVDGLKRKAMEQVKQFASIDDHAIELFGVCKKCSK